MITCSICGRPITDKQSVKIGVGPICRIRKKIDSIDKAALADRAEYVSGYLDGIFWIEDRHGIKSVTSDLKNILKEIFSDDPELLLNRKIVYRDCMEIWDEISFEMENGEITKIDMYAIGEKDLRRAITKINRATVIKNREKTKLTVIFLDINNIKP